MRLFIGQVRDETDAEKGQAIRAKRSVDHQALKALVSDQFSLVQPESESKSPNSIQFKTTV